MAKQQFKEGDELRIVNNDAGHGYDNNTKVYVRHVDSGEGYSVEDENGDSWWVTLDDVQAWNTSKDNYEITF